MTRFPNFRGARTLVRYASTVLTVSLLVTLKVETACPLKTAPVAQPGFVRIGDVHREVAAR